MLDALYRTSVCREVVRHSARNYDISDGAPYSGVSHGMLSPSDHTRCARLWGIIQIMSVGPAQPLQTTKAAT